MPALNLALHFIRREVRNRYLGSFSGGLWALIQPLIQLAVYAFVFVYVFKTRLPGADAPDYVPFLLMGLWPWNAFAEALSRATTAIQDNAALIGKIALPRELLVFAAVAASFCIQGIGFLAVVLVLRLIGVSIDLVALPVVLLDFVQLFIFTLGCAYLLSAVQVFVRDLASALPQLLQLWMFCSPVLYARSALPERYQGWLAWNPFTPYPEFFRSLLLHYGDVGFATQAIALVVAIVALGVGLSVFRRLGPHFEDFL